MSSNGRGEIPSELITHIEHDKEQKKVSQVVMSETGDGISCKERRVKPSDRVWMCNGKHQTWVHPDQVEQFMRNGYEVKERTPGGRVIRKLSDIDPATQPGFYPGKHKGQTIYILGTGTSLTPEIGKKLTASRAITIGVNDIFRLCDPFFIPTYHVHADYNEKDNKDQFSVINREGLEAMQKYGTQLFCPRNHEQEYTTDVEHQDFYSDASVAFAAHYDMIKGDLRLGHSSSSTFHALQLAVILGGSPIVLLGVDYYMAKGKHGLHFYDEYHDLVKKKQRKWKPAMTKSLEASRKKLDHDLTTKALPLLKEMGIMVINGNPKSKLESFPKMDMVSSL